MERRFAWHLPIEFRRVGSDLWFSGYTEKMGSCCVLFRSGEIVEPNARIEIIFRTPATDPCNLICIATVLRVEEPIQPDFLPAIVVTIDRWSFVRV